MSRISRRDYARTPCSASDVRGASPLVAIENETPPTLVVDPPLPGPLAHGKVFIRCRAQNLRVPPVVGTAATRVSPRTGPVHSPVDDPPWHFVDATGQTVIPVGLDPGPNRILFEIADPDNHAMSSGTIAFTVPAKAL